MRVIAKVIRILCAKFHRNRLTIVQDIQDYVVHVHFLRLCTAAVIDAMN